MNQIKAQIIINGSSQRQVGMQMIKRRKGEETTAYLSRVDNKMTRICNSLRVKDKYVKKIAKILDIPAENLMTV